MEIVIALIALILILLGIAGAVLPFLPGPPLGMAGLLIYGWYNDFLHVSPSVLIIFGILTIITIIFDIFGPGLTARGYKASKKASWGAIVGGLLGILTMGPLGVFLGPFLGAFLGEYVTVMNHQQALVAARGAMIGILAGAILKLIVSLIMFSYFILVMVDRLTS